MLKNYIKIALRNIQNNPIYSAINIFGLTIGIVCSLLLILYVQYEMSYDSFHSKKEYIYRVNTSATLQDTKLNVSTSPSPLGPTITKGYSQVLDFVRVFGGGETLIRKDHQTFYEENIYFTDSSFFTMFDYQLLEGDSANCLKAPNSIVISKSLADKLFANQDAIGQTIKTGGDETTRTVTGIMADPVLNSHLKAKGLISYSSLDSKSVNWWGGLNDQTYLLIAKESNPEITEADMATIYDTHMEEMFSKFGATATFSLQPMTDIHLYSEQDNDMEPSGNITYLYVFGSIAFIVLLIACINYMNLATARSVSRAKEVGIRKALGSHKGQLMMQFMTESVVIALVALVFSMMLTFFIIPTFNENAGVELNQYFIYDFEVITILTGIIVFIGAVGGSYPAFYLSRFKAAEVLKGKTKRSSGNEILRKVLVIVQFSISLFMIISTWIIFDQLQYMQNKALGFNKDQVINVTLEGKNIREKGKILSDQMLLNPLIEAVGTGYGVPGSGSYNMNGISVETESGEIIEKVFQRITVDNQFFETLQIPVVEGRNFLPNIGNDTAASVMVNEQMVKHMGWTNPIGKKFSKIINQKLETQDVHVVGVVRDYHLRSLQEPIEPLIIFNGINNGQLVVRLKAEKIKEALAVVASSYGKVITNRPFEYSFLDQDFADQYESDQTRGELFIVFSVLTVFIACLGLFGLASYTAENRKKEIGVRKVVGASIPSIVLMISKDLVKLVLLSILVAFPLSYLAMNEWLQGFAFRSEIKWTSFALSAALMILIAFGTVLYHSLRSAMANPTTALKED